MRDGKGVWISAMSTNLAIAGVIVGMCALMGIQDFLLVQLPIILLAGSVGVWLFYVQHQFEDTYWARQDGWSFHAGALQGATHYDLPGVLRWFTANIGIHHVHHLASRIPSYRLREALADHPELRDVGRLTLRQSLKCFRLALWNEESRRLVAFRDHRAPVHDRRSDRRRTGASQVSGLHSLPQAIVMKLDHERTLPPAERERE